jgi:hypothetical protein
MGSCSGDTARWPTHLGLQIVDKLVVPEATGDYVMQWRWDCEGSAQVCVASYLRVALHVMLTCAPSSLDLPPAFIFARSTYLLPSRPLHKVWTNCADITISA